MRDVAPSAHVQLQTVRDGPDGRAVGAARALHLRHRQAPGLGKPARRLADQAHSLVVKEGLSYRDAAALLLETTWVVLLAEAPPAFDG